MGRKSKLTPDQWEEAAKRLIDGASEREVARDYGISATTLREHMEKIGRSPTVQKVAGMIVETQAALHSLPISAQITAQNLAAKLRAISDSLASAAQLGAATAHRLNAIANSEVQKVDDEQPLESSIETLKGVSALTKLANDSASIGLNLLSANKERVAKLDEPAAEQQAPLRPQVTRDEWLKLHAAN